jgi:hypothetical protein
LDAASRLVSVKDEIQNLQCECAVRAGTYASVADCRADIFKLEPSGDAQCLRDLFVANPLDEPAIDCQLSGFEGLASCIASANCNDEAGAACVTDFDARLNACPKGPATSGDSFGIDLADGVSIPFQNGLILNLPAAEAYFADENFYPSNALSNLPTFTNDDADPLNDDVDSLSSGKLTNTDGTLEYQFDITDFTVAIDPIETYKYSYTAVGTLTNSLGGDVLDWNGVPLSINVKHDIQAAPDSTSEASAVRQAQWMVMADYTIGVPTVPGGITSSAPTQLLAKDSFFDASVDSCQNLPVDQLTAIYGASLDANIEERCRCAPDDAARAQCLLARDNVSPRSDCLAQLVDNDPLAAEVTECVIEDLDLEANSMAGLACCANPGDTGCLDRSGYFDATQTFRNCASSAAARDVAEAVLFCMGPPPPPPPAPVDFSDDPARCDNVTSLASGIAGDFMVVTASRKLDGDGNPYPRHYMILDLTLPEIGELAALDAAQPLLTALYGLDAGNLTEVKDQCELPNIVSIALDGDGTPPDFGSINDRIRDLQNGLEDLPAFIARGRAQAEAYAEQLYKQLVCPAVSVIVSALSLPVPGGNIAAQIVADIINAMIKQAILGVFGCLS